MDEREDRPWPERTGAEYHHYPQVGRMLFAPISASKAIGIDVAPAAAMGIDNLERGLLARELCNIPRRPHVFHELLILFVRAVMGARWLQSGATVD